jgi:hypothetical protein
MIDAMTQLWPEGLPIEVDMRDGQPIALYWQYRRRTARAVTDQWLIHDNWWQDEIWRHYFQMITADGLLCVIYRDLLDDRWYLERVYD